MKKRDLEQAEKPEDEYCHADSVLSKFISMSNAAADAPKEG